MVNQSLLLGFTMNVKKLFSSLTNNQGRQHRHGNTPVPLNDLGDAAQELKPPRFFNCGNLRKSVEQPWVCLAVKVAGDGALLRESHTEQRACNNFLLPAIQLGSVTLVYARAG